MQRNCSSASKPAASRWKNGSKPSAAVLLKLAHYFGVTVEYLKGEENENKPLINENEEITEYLQELQSRDEMRMLFKVTKDCSKEEIEQAVRVIEALRKGN